MHILKSALKVMANEKRLAILRLLMEEREMSLQAVSQRLSLPLKTASRNLNLLKQSGFLLSWTRRAQAVYQINADSSEFHIIALLTALRTSYNSESKKKTRGDVDRLLEKSFTSLAGDFNKFIRKENNQL